MNAAKRICCLAVACIFSAAWADLNRADEWKPNPDGGHPPAVTAAVGPDGKPALRIVYRDRSPHWGNIRHALRIPPEATGLRFQIRVLEAAPGAALHVWLFEKDKDGWLVRVRPGNVNIDEAPKNQWIDVFIPFSSLRFQPRGDRKPEFLTVDHMLIGCNFADLTAEIANMTLTRQTVRSEPPPDTPNLQIEKGRRGNVAILSEPTFEKRPSHPDPQRLQRLLRAAGYGVTFLRAGDLTHTDVLTPERIHLLVLPCAPWFPLAAREALLRYLRRGGAFLSIGGYAFDRPLLWTGNGWTAQEPTVPAAEISAQDPVGATLKHVLNTRYGKPGDTLRLSREQIGAFDPSYLLDHVHGLRAASSQFVIPGDWQCERTVKGFAAVGLTGSNSPVFPDGWARLIPLIQAVDRFGRPRGPVLSMMLHYAGPWRGSAWAFTGVTDVDLFNGDLPGLDAALPRIVERLVRPRFLYGLETDQVCVRPGERLRISVRVFADAPVVKGLRVRFECTGRAVEEAAVEPGREPGADLGAQTAFVVSDDAEDLVHVRAVLLDSNRVIDVMETAFVVRSPQIRASAPKITIDKCYFRMDGRPVFLCGTNQTGMMWYASGENPLTWQRDFRKMSDYGVNILRVLHFSPFARTENVTRRPFRPEDLKERPRVTRRKTDAIVQLAAKNRVAVFLTCHDWMPVELTEAQLAVQRDWNRFWAARYRDVPGMLYDIQNEPSVHLRNEPHIEKLFKEWLERRYGSVDQALSVWQAAGAPARIDLGARPESWQDLRGRDLDLFRSWLFRRWVRANAAGVRAGAPDAPVTVGLLQHATAADKFAADDFVDFTCTHFYGGVDAFRRTLKFMDRRVEGHPFTLGEFGTREAHDGRVHGRTGDPADTSVRWFLAVGHYALGMGAAFVANWDWKDMPDCVFPWGVNHPDLVSKPVLEAYRNMALLFRLVQPRYEPPAVWLVVPDNNRFGWRTNQLHAAILRAVEWLMDANVPFGLVNEDALRNLPDAARVLVWPSPYCPSDETFARVSAFVLRGGSLLFTGDVRFSSIRRPERLKRIAGLGFDEDAAPPPASPFDPASAARPIAPVDGRPGHGMVRWIQRPIELLNDPNGPQIYRDFLRDVRASCIEIAPPNDDGRVHAFETPTVNGGNAVVLYNDASERRTVRVRLVRVPGTEITIDLDPGSTGFVLLARDGAVLAAETDGAVQTNGRMVLDVSGHQAVAALDGRGLAGSERLLVLPFSAGAVRIPRNAAAGNGWVTETGEFRDGKWRTLERAATKTEAGKGLFVETDPETARDIRLLAPAAALEDAVKRASALLYLRW